MIIANQRWNFRVKAEILEASEVDGPQSKWRLSEPALVGSFQCSLPLPWRSRYLALRSGSFDCR